MKNSLLLLATFSLSMASAQNVWFHDRFDRTDTGPAWKVASGSWKMNQDELQITTGDYDQLLASNCYVYDPEPFSIEVTLRGIRAGIFFSLETQNSKAISHMVRFDEKSILTGYMNAVGEYTATNTFDVEKMPTGWTNLRVDVDPGKKSYEVFVDGKSVGVDEHLLFESGYVGLQASDGLSEFRSVKVTGHGMNTPPARSSKGSTVRFQHVGYVKTVGNNVAIYDPREGFLQTLDRDGKLVELAILKMKPKPPQEVMAGENRYVIEGKRILVKNENGTVVDSITECLVAPSCLLTDYGILQHESPSLYVTDPGANAVFSFSLDGRYLKSFTASSIGGFIAPRGMDFFGHDQIVVADDNRLVFVGRNLEDVQPSAQPLSPTREAISWPHTNQQAPSLQFSTDGRSWTTIAAKQSGSLNTVTIENLKPLSRYSFKPSPLLRTIPGDAGAAKEFRFSTPPSDSTMMAYTRLRVLCMVYRTISYRDVYPGDKYPQIPDGRTITDDELNYLREACRFNTEFYFRNSSCKVVLDFDFYVVQDTLWLHELGDKDPYWLSCNERVTRDFEKAVQKLGRKPIDYDGLVCPYAWVNYPPRRKSALSDPTRTDSINIRQAYGGGTNGVPAPWKYGKTCGYTGNPFQDKFSRQDWLITHEFHHQIDALMDASGYPEYYHADQPWKMPGRFGEDFDFNAHIIRNAGLDWWLNLKFGTLAGTKDFDHDGVPDDDPSLPFDEKRLGGDPTKKDTDGDGLSDLQEVMAGTSQGTDLSGPRPLYEADPFIQYKVPADPWDLIWFGAVASRDMIQACWDDSALYIGYAGRKRNLLIQIDAGNTGWFHGFDDFQIRISNTGDSARVVDYYLRDCSSWTDPPRDRKDILKNSELSVFTRTLETTYRPKPGWPNFVVKNFLTVRIPRNDKFGLNLVKGKKLSLRIGLQDIDDRWMWDELFERNYMMQVELK